VVVLNCNVEGREWRSSSYSAFSPAFYRRVASRPFSSLSCFLSPTSDLVSSSPFIILPLRRASSSSRLAVGLPLYQNYHNKEEISASFLGSREQNGVVVVVVLWESRQFLAGFDWTGPETSSLTASV
jgi:hypothetical protein